MTHIPEKGSHKLLVDFTQDTTLHGLRQITKKGVNIVRRIVWLGLLLTCAGIFVDYAYERVRTYMRFDININVQYDYVDSLEFPAVTLCNTNTFKLSRSVEYGFYKDVQKIMDYKGKLKGIKQCVPNEQFECQPGECISKERLCDFFPDCRNKADELPENCDGKCQIVCVEESDSPSERAVNLQGRCFVYDRSLESLHQLDNQAFFSRAANENQTDLYLFYDGSRWVISEELFSCDNCSAANEDKVVAYFPTTRQRLIFHKLHRWATDPVRVDSSNSSNASTTVNPTIDPTTNLTTEIVTTQTAKRRKICGTTEVTLGTTELGNSTVNWTAEANSSLTGLTGTTAELGVTTGLGTTSSEISSASGETDSTTEVGSTSGLDSTTVTELVTTTGVDATTELDAITEEDCIEPWEDMETGPGLKVAMMLSCNGHDADAPLLDEVLRKLQPNMYSGQRTLSDLYEITAPKLRDTLMRCTWRGEPCSHINFTAKYTDMGLCFTFVSSQRSTLPGPGYGLGLTLNIEQYDYTSHSDDGVGIRVLLHDEKDEPVMDQKSFAISPGLYTLVSVDRTQVDGLPKPWGDCVDEKLEYYSIYSMATCRLECENIVIRRECNCRDIYMPAIGDEPVCDIATYLTCGRRAIEMNRKFGGNDECLKCETPCREEKYVPSMSFSAISTRQENLGPAMKDLKLRIAAKVQEAREYTYRLQADKYRESLRMFTSVADGVSNAHALLQAALDAFASDRNEVGKRVAEVQTDCVWFTTGQNELVRVLQDDIIEAGLSYVEYIKTNVLSPVRGFINTISLGVNDDEKNQTKEWRVTMKDKVSELTSALSRASSEEAPRLISRIEETSADFPLSLQLSEIKPLLSHSRVECEACLSHNGSLLNRLKTRLLKFLRQTVTPDLGAMTSILTTDRWNRRLASWCFPNLPAWWLHNCIRNFVTSASEGANVLQHLANLETDVNKHLRSVETHLLEPTRTTLNFAKELMRLTATKCGSELQRPLEGYMDSHARMQIVLKEMIDRTVHYGKRFDVESRAYEEVNITLATMANDMSLTVLADDLESDLATLKGLLDQRNISLTRVAQCINVVNYWFLTQTPPESLRDNSKYWASLHLESPKMLKPQQQDQDSDLVTSSEKYVITDTKIEAYWRKLSDTLDDYKKRTEDVISRFESEITPAKNYLAGYLRGNELEDSFLGQNVLQLEIFYKELAERKVEQHEAYRYQALLGELGGLMGLLLGGSVITMVEFMELLLLLCAYKCMAVMTKRKKVSDVTVVKPARLEEEETKDF